MGSLSFVYPDQVAGEALGFFALGDAEVQRKLALPNSSQTLDDLVVRLKISTLLHDRILHSASFYFESGLSRDLYTSKEILPLFREGRSLLVVSEEVESYADHVDKKRLQTPATFDAYHSNEARSHLDSLGTFKSAFKRTSPITSIISALWMADLTGGESATSLRNLVRMADDPEVRNRLQGVLSDVCQKREGFQLSPEYVHSALLRADFPQQLMSPVLDRLLEFYVAASAKAMNDAHAIGAVEFGNHAWNVPVLDCHNVALFLKFSELLGIKDELCQLPAEQIVHLGESDDFRRFFREYCAIVDEAKSIQQNLVSLRRQKSLEDSGVEFKQSSLYFLSWFSLLEIVSRRLGDIPNVSLLMAGVQPCLEQVLVKIGLLDKTHFYSFRKRVLEEFDIALRKKRWPGQWDARSGV